jgi:hypothetical protein
VSAAEPLRDAVARFLAAFETVFHQDWAYTRSMLGMGTPEESEKAKAKLLEIFGESPQPPGDPEATFLDPRDPDADRDWGNYALLLEAYAKLRTAFAASDAG